MSKTRKIKQISQLDHAKRKSMWVGSKKIQNTEIYIISGQTCTLENVSFAPAWYKIVDEIVVNAIDQWVNYPNKVDTIKINLDRETGVVTILNTGPSIGVYETQNLNGVKMYAPQLIASEFLSGDNLDDDNDDARITGGTNGAGLKLTNAFSVYLTITTVDTKTKLHYTQTFREGLTIIEEPVIRKITNEQSFTEIKFLPDYKLFGYLKYEPAMYDELEKLMIIRAYQVLVFTNINICYNDKKIELPVCTELQTESNLYKFASMFRMNDYGIWETTLTSSDPIYKKLQWNVCIGISDGKFRQVSLINGIYVYGGGSHIKHLQRQIVDNLKSRVESIIKKTKTKFNPNYIINNLFIVFKGSIVKPEFTSQIKDTLNDPIEKFESYKFKQREYNEIWTLLEPHIMSLFLDKYKDKKKTRVVRGAVNVPKCTDAKFAGHKTKYKQCTLIICEGDSAMGTVHDGITNKGTNLNYDYYGTFSIQGVPMNARKEVSSYVTNKTTTLIRNNKLQKNERFDSLVKVLGLDYEKTYISDEEFATVRYGKITAAVDQDDDGKGNIFGLLINFFILFWPALATRNYITRFNTPIIRAYPKNNSKFVEEFESLKTYKQWVLDKFGDEEKMSSAYTVKYYKGLGSHKKLEIPYMFKNFEDRLCTYTLDPDALQKIEAYFGNDTTIRKQELSTPVSRPESLSKVLDITEQLDRDLKAYQRDNILRKLPHIMDGSVPSRRKVIYTARLTFGNTNSEMKVNAFVNETSKTTHYHHGEMSLAATVTKMAQEFPGARHLPMLRPLGQFGTRSNGGKDSADLRYTYTQLNKKLCFSMFPKDDDYLLKYMFDDGVRCEPEYYCPIIPMSILENMEIPATGWKVKLWARDIFQVITNVRNLITGKIKKATPMSIWLKDNIGEIRQYKNKDYSVGKYKYIKSKNTIVITELPLGKYSSSFIGDYASEESNQLCNKPQFKSRPDDKTNDDGVDITFHLTETGWSEITENYGNETFDCVEDFMNLKTCLDNNINMISVDGSVREFENYEEVIDIWYPARKQLYTDRIDRHIILTNLMIVYLKNIIRFTKHHQEYNITPKTSLIEFSTILKDNKYDKFSESLLHSPKYTSIQELSNIITKRYNEDSSSSISYEYLIKLSYRDMIECSCKKRLDLLNEYKNKLKDLQDDTGDSTLNNIHPNPIFKGSKTWIRELDELEIIIKTGLKLGWSYGKDIAKFR